MLIHLHFYVLALSQPGTSEVKSSDSHFLKEFVFMLKLSQKWKFLPKNEPNSGIRGCLWPAPKLQQPVHLNCWQKVSDEPQTGRGQEQMWASQMDLVNHDLNHRGRPVHLNTSSLFGVLLSHSQGKLLCAKEISYYSQSEWEFSLQLKRGIWTLNEEKIIHKFQTIFKIKHS